MTTASNSRSDLTQSVAGEEDPGASGDLLRPPAPSGGTGENNCPQCDGTGKVGDDPCPGCGGSGVLTVGILGS